GRGPGGPDRQDRRPVRARRRGPRSGAAVSRVDRGVRLLARPAEPRRGFPRPDRPQRRPAGGRRGAGMTAAIAPPALTVASHATVRRPRVLRNTLTIAWRA